MTVSAAGLRGEILLHMANDAGIIIGTGSACSSNAKSRYSKIALACGYDEKTADGVLRISVSKDTQKEEILRAIEVLNVTASDLKNRMK